MRAMRQWLPAVVTAVAAAAAPASNGWAALPDCDWEWVNPTPPRNTIYRVASKVGWFLAVGAEGTILLSQDGLSWERIESGVDADLFGVEFGTTWIVAVGDDVVLRSSDGREWLVVLSIDGAHFTDVAYGAGRFVAVGSGLGGQVATSATGAQWTLATAPWGGVPSTVTATDEGFAIAVGTEIWESPDGVDWSFEGAVPTSLATAEGGGAVKMLDPDLFGLDRVDLAWSGQLLLWAAGSQLWSRDGDGVWELVLELDGCATFEDWLGVAAGPGWALASGVSGCPTPYLQPVVSLYLSLDGGVSFAEPWEDGLAGFPALGRYGSHWVALGALGDAMTSTDATDWACPNGGCTALACDDELVDLAVGGDLMVAVGGIGLCDNAIKRQTGSTTATSEDGEQWAIHPLSSDRFKGVAWTGDEFVGVGDGWLASSTDGSQWTQEAAPDAADLHSVAAHDGTTVVSGKTGALYVKQGSASWLKPYHFWIEDLDRVVWDGEQFLIVGTGGLILHSPDGLNLSQSLTGTDVDLHGVAAGSTGRIAVGDDGVVLASSDGVLWSPRWSGFDGVLGDVAYGDGKFVAVGWKERPDGRRPAVALVSADGDQWTHFDVPAEALRRVAWTGNAWVAVGEERSIVRNGCLWTLVTFDTDHLHVPQGGTAELEVRIDGTVSVDTELEVESSRPGLVVVPDTAEIPAGSDRTVVVVTGAGVVSGATVTVTLPEQLGGGSGVVQVSVQPPLWRPRRPSGRVTP